MIKAGRKLIDTALLPDNSGYILSMAASLEDNQKVLDITQKLYRLAGLSRDALVVEWAKTNKQQIPLNLSRGLLMRAVAYQLQSGLYGGLKKSPRERLHKIAAGTNGESTSSSHISPGTRLLREWHGVTHELVIEEKGILYQGKMYRSLSEVARAITGTKWSGPVFFGLRKRSK